jgi:hypothetical protein
MCFSHAWVEIRAMSNSRRGVLEVARTVALETTRAGREVWLMVEKGDVNIDTEEMHGF